jgi:hypothetical protein
LQQERSKSFTLGGICLDNENGFWLSGQWTSRVPHRAASVKRSLVYQTGATSRHPGGVTGFPSL